MNTSPHLPPSDDLPSGILPPHISLSHLKSYFKLAPHLLAHLVSRLMASPGTHSFVQLGRLRRRSSHSQMQGGSRKCSQCDSFVHCWNFFTQGKGGWCFYVIGWRASGGNTGLHKLEEGDQSLPPTKYISILFLPNLWMFSYMAEGTLQIWLRWVTCPALSRCAQWRHRGFMIGRGSQESRERNLKVLEIWLSNQREMPRIKKHRKD